MRSGWHTINRFDWVGIEFSVSVYYVGVPGDTNRRQVFHTPAAPDAMREFIRENMEDGSWTLKRQIPSIPKYPRDNVDDYVVCFAKKTDLNLFRLKFNI